MSASRPRPSIPELVDRFARSLIAQDQAENSVEGNRHARRGVKAFETLIKEYGDAGREGLTMLFKHERQRIRIVAAAFLLRYAHEEAMKVLRHEAKGDDFGAFCASQSIKNWNEGLWELDLLP